MCLQIGEIFGCDLELLHHGQVLFFDFVVVGEDGASDGFGVVGVVLGLAPVVFGSWALLCH